jgi:excisionase family DNA binding protein
MMHHSQPTGANGDATTDPPDAAAAQLTRPMSTDRTAAMPAELHALPALLTVGETAEVLRVGRSWVYEHATELGAIKLGRGRTAPVRIPRDEVRRILGAALPRREQRWLPARRARKAERPNGDLRARPRL